jgi:hypothetical protein
VKIMTDAEFEALQAECREYLAKTSFPKPVSEDADNAHTHHAEYGVAAH